MNIPKFHNNKMRYQNNKFKCAVEEDDLDEHLEDYQSTIYTLGNKIYFYQDICAETILHLKKEIHNLEKNIAELKIKYSIEPVIELHLYSNGGDVFMGLDMYSHIKKSTIQIDTYVDGMIASAATFIFLAGKNRYVGEYGHILIHQLSTEFWGKYEDLKDEFNNSKTLMANIKDLYQTNCSQPKTKLNEILKRELYLSSDDCIKYRIATNIL